jgi:glutamine---fructose-6-phosphate transaminase (isomerizing)
MAKEQEIKYAMHKEIYEEPKVIKKILSKYIKNKKVYFQELSKHEKKLNSIKRIVFLGCGTSYNASFLGNLIFEEIAGIDCEYEFADEFIARKPVIGKNSLVIISSQSGETADAIKASILARKKGAIILVLVNKEKSKLEQSADITIYLDAGEEKAVAATKTFVAQIMVLTLLAIYFSLLRNKKYNSKLLSKELKTIPAKIERIIKDERNIKSWAKKLVKTKNLVILGKKFNYPIALEGAQKIKETCYLPIEGFATNEFKHGPKAIINKDFPCLFIAPKDTTYQKNFGLIKELKKIGARIFIITTKGNKSLNKISDNIIYIPKSEEIVNPMLTVIPLQLLAFHLSAAKKINVDQPRNIGKFVR